jgi:hypothetical protein
LHLLRLAQDRALTPPASPIGFTTLTQSPETRLKETLDVEYIIFVMYGGVTEHRRMLESIRLFGEK